MAGINVLPGIFSTGPEAAIMFSHSAIWDAIDTLAKRHGLSPSGLARLAGLDSTAFNKSKRISKDGRERWPSTESIAKILEATKESFDTLFLETGTYQQLPQTMLNPTVPLLGFAQAGQSGFFDSGGFPAGQGWDEVILPVAGEDGTYALEVAGDSMLPLYRDGDIIIVSPREQLRRGDRVVVRMKTGALVAKILYRQTANNVELHPLVDAKPAEVIDLKDIDWIARILWASQ